MTSRAPRILAAIQAGMAVGYATCASTIWGRRPAMRASTATRKLRMRSSAYLRSTALCAGIPLIAMRSTTAPARIRASTCAATKIPKAGKRAFGYKLLTTRIRKLARPQPRSTIGYAARQLATDVRGGSYSSRMSAHGDVPSPLHEAAVARFPSSGLNGLVTFAPPTMDELVDAAGAG